VISTALALVSLPGLAGSRVPSAVEPVPAGAFQPYPVLARDSRSPILIAGLDRAHRSVGIVDGDTTFYEPGVAPESGPTDRVSLDQPESAAGSERKPPRYSITGDATFYDNGTTAMRLPRGTIVIICGDGGCIERVVTDYGPQAPQRVVDLYRPDFFRICGCPSWSGVTKVTVHVY
jgi:hypothetical protein